MPISMLNSLLAKLEKGLEAAATAALPAATAAESRQLLEGSKSDVEGVIKGSLLRTDAGAVSYVPVARATVAKASEPEGFVLSVCDGKDSPQKSVSDVKALFSQCIPGVLTIGAGKGGRADSVRSNGLSAVLSPVLGVTPHGKKPLRLSYPIIL